MLKKFLFLAIISQFLISQSFAASVFAGPREAYQELLDGKAVFIDVRESDEVKDGMISGAFWIPLSDMQAAPVETNQKVREVSAEKTIYIYCKSGRRSQVFIRHMMSAGLTGTNLGAYQDLLKEGLPSN